MAKNVVAICTGICFSRCSSETEEDFLEQSWETNVSFSLISFFVSDLIDASLCLIFGIEFYILQFVFHQTFNYYLHTLFHFHYMESLVATV